MGRDTSIFKHVIFTTLSYYVYSLHCPIILGSASDIDDAYKAILQNLKKGGYHLKGQEKELAEMKEKDKKNEEAKKELMEKDKKNEEEKKELKNTIMKMQEDLSEKANHISLLENKNENIKRSLNAGTGGVRKSNRKASAEANYRLALCSKL